LSNNQVKWLRSLKQKKQRDAEKVFVAEGEKLVGDLIPYFRLKCLVVNSQFTIYNSQFTLILNLFQDLAPHAVRPHDAKQLVSASRSFLYPDLRQGEDSLSESLNSQSKSHKSQSESLNSQSESLNSQSESRKSIHPSTSCTPVAFLPPKTDINYQLKNFDYFEANETQMSQISSMKTPQGILAVFEQKPLSMGLGLGKVPSIGEGVGVRSNDWLLVLDGVQDPGNLGTIIRTADWFGFRCIVCSKDTADCYNPKVVQATMGALGRVDIYYTDLNEFLTASKTFKLPVYGTLLDGKNLYDSPLPEKGILIMGNEGKGISPQIRRFITHPTLIPSYPKDTPTSESLNVATATAIMLAEIRRTR